MGIDVTGGIGGIQAFLDDLVGLSHLLIAAADTVTHASHEAEFGRLEIGGCSGLDFGINNHRLDDILAALTAPSHQVIGELHTVGWLVKLAAASYDQADHGVLHMLTSAVTGLPGTLFKGGERLLTSGDPLAALQQVLTADPELTDLVAELSALRLSTGASAQLCDDGQPIVTDASNDVSVPAVTPPRSLGNLMTALSERNDGASGEISVSFVYSLDGQRHAIVDIPGTKSWSVLHTDDVTSMATNVRAIQGRPTSYEKGVLEAMGAAGVTYQDDVMLVGHSEGGMVAVDTARDAAAAGHFHISHVVTAGAPVSRTVGSLPARCGSRARA